MNSNRLRYFIVLNETESIRKAAETLHISPAALSKAIKQFELEIGIKLLVPSGRGIAITEAGRQLAQLAQPLMQNLEKIKKNLGQQKMSPTTCDPIRIGSFEIFTTHFLSQIVNALPAKCELCLHELMPGEIEKALLEHEVDYGLTYIPIPTAGIQHLQVTFVEMRIFGHGELFHHTPWKDIPFVVPMYPLLGSPNKYQGLDGWPDGQIKRFIKYQVTMMESGLELCRQGKAVAYLPTFIVTLHNKTVKSHYNLEPIPFPKTMSPSKLAVYLVKRKADPIDQIFENIVNALQKISSI